MRRQSTAFRIGARHECTHGTAAASPFKQPKAVFAVAFACVISFMGIGLVDPILPAISHELHASPSEVTLLFTSYLVVTAVAMLITNWVSSRLGAKKTLIAGLILIVVFSALAGASPSINDIIGFRAGWGVGNALFIATSLAVIVASASGGFAGAIVLYETALGVGIAIGPLLGGTLGEISWRGPFFGVAVLMAIALIATVVLVEPTPKPAHKTGLSAPLRALRHRGLLTMSLTALCYNWGFFTVLGYAPFPMNLSPIRLGLVFTGWGILVAIFAVFGAPRLQAALGIARTMYLNLAAFSDRGAGHRHLDDGPGGADPGRHHLRDLHRGEQHGHHPGRDDRVPGGEAGGVGGLQLRPVHRRRPGALRGRPAGHRAQYPRAVLHRGGCHRAGIVVLSTAHGLLTDAERIQAEQVPAAPRITPPRRRPGPVVIPVAGAATSADGPAGVILAAIDDSPDAGLITETAARLASATGRGVYVVHAQEDVTAGETATDGEDLAAAQALVRRQLELLAAHRVPARGEILRHASGHGAAGRMAADTRPPSEPAPSSSALPPTASCRR